MLGKKLGNNIDDFVADYVVFDFETTGLNPFDGDRIIEMSAVRVINHKVVEKFATLVNPEQPISPEATAVNGITDITDKIITTDKITAKTLQIFVFIKTLLLNNNIIVFNILSIVKRLSMLKSYW